MIEAAFAAAIGLARLPYELQRDVQREFGRQLRVLATGERAEADEGRLGRR